MKNTLSMIALAVLTVGLLGSCSKINERLDNLDKRIDGIENEQIATINGQIDGIESSIADLKQIRSDVGNLKQTAESHGEDIFALQEADETLGNRIDNLEDYLENVLPNYAEKEWVEATYSTLEQYDSTCTAIAEINVKIGELDTKIAKDIKACTDSMKTWVNEKLDAYYTAAQMDAELAKMRAAIDSAKAAGKISDTKADSVARELTKTKTAVDTAKSHIRSEYKAAIKTAIDSSEGRLTKKIQEEITKVNDRIDVLADRVTNLGIAVSDLASEVTALENMIQSVTIVPAFSDGSVEFKDGSLRIDCIIAPTSAVESLDLSNFVVLVKGVAQTKAGVGIDSVKIASSKDLDIDTAKGVASIKVKISDKLPGDDSTVTVAVNVSKAKTNFTTNFVPITDGNEYVELAGLIWAKCNIGAENETDPGYYFSWGNTEGYVHVGTDPGKWVKASDGSEFDGGFTSNNYNSTTGASLSGDIPVDPAYDAARANWGEPWRMPTKEEFITLFKECFAECTTDYNDTGVPGLIVWEAKVEDAGWLNNGSGKGQRIQENGTYTPSESHSFSNPYNPNTDSHLFFPITGYGLNQSRLAHPDKKADLISYYLLRNKSYVTGINLNFRAVQFFAVSWFGCTIRPVKAGAVTVTESHIGFAE